LSILSQFFIGLSGFMLKVSKKQFYKPAILLTVSNLVCFLATVGSCHLVINIHGANKEQLSYCDREL